MKPTFALISGEKQEGESIKTKPADSLMFLRNEASYTVEQVDIAAEFLPDLLSIVDDEGIKLLLHHLEPLFTCPQTRLHACMQLFDMLAQALGPKNTAKTFLKCLVSLFDSHALENYEVITRQTFLSQIIVRFGLDGFLKHFISFVVDAVAFKAKGDSPVEKGDRLSIYGITPGISAPEMEYPSKDVPLDIDDDLDLPGNFLREASEDQDVKIGSYSIGMEDLETDIEENNFSVNLQNVGEDRTSIVKDDEAAERVTLLPRRIIDEEGEGPLFHGNISDDDDRVPDGVDGGHSSKVVGFGVIHDGLELGGDVVVEGHPGNGGSDGTEFEDIELQPVNGTADERTRTSEKASESQGQEGNIAEMEVLQGAKSGHDTRRENVAVQVFNTSRSRSIQIYEPELGKAEGRGLELSKGERDHGAGVNTLTGEEEMFEKCVEEGVPGKIQDTTVEELNDEIDEQGHIDDTLEKGNGASGEEEELEDDEEESFSEDDSHDNVILEAENDEGRRDKRPGNENTKPVVAAYQIKTFYNGTKSKSLERERGAQNHRDELTPGAISGIAAESIVWLAPRLGPVLTSKYISSQLLTMLPHCYMGHVTTNDDDEEEERMVSDRNAKWLLFCLCNFCTLYGEAFMLNQYLPFIEKTVSLCRFGFVAYACLSCENEA